MKCPKCQKPSNIIVQYYYSDGTRYLGVLEPDSTATLCGIKPAIWEKTEYICEKHGIVILTLDKTMDIRGGIENES